MFIEPRCVHCGMLQRMPTKQALALHIVGTYSGCDEIPLAICHLQSISRKSSKQISSAITYVINFTTSPLCAAHIPVLSVVITIAAGGSKVRHMQRGAINQSNRVSHGATGRF